MLKNVFVVKITKIAVGDGDQWRSVAIFQTCQTLVLITTTINVLHVCDMYIKLCALKFNFINCH
jgi:hypothetical protein